MLGELSMSHQEKGYEHFICFSPLGFHILAGQYLLAAKDFKTIDNSPVHYFLYCKSIELSLKGFLLAKNVPMNILRGKKGIGHDLEKALKEAESRGMLDIVEIPYLYREELRKANYYYEKKQGFEYCDNYEVLRKWGNLPSLKVLCELASNLVERLEKVCFEAVNTLVEKYGEGKG